MNKELEEWISQEILYKAEESWKKFINNPPNWFVKDIEKLNQEPLKKRYNPSIKLNDYSIKIKTDLEKFIELYKSFGIECKITKYENVIDVLVISRDDGLEYEISFTKEGKFKEHSIYIGL